MPRLSSRPPGYTIPPMSRIGRRPRDTAIIRDYRPPPTQIPICWFTGDIILRLDPPVNFAQITLDTGDTRTAMDLTSINSGKGNFPFYATLNSALIQDASSLAAWTIAYQATPRMRAPSLTLDLLAGGRTDAEIAMLLRMPRFSRFQITGVPAEFPEGASSLILTGVTHERGIRVRRMTLTTGSVIGSTPGVPGPWFRIGSSLVDSSDQIPF